MEPVPQKPHFASIEIEYMRPLPSEEYEEFLFAFAKEYNFENVVIIENKISVTRPCKYEALLVLQITDLLQCHHFTYKVRWG